MHIKIIFYDWLPLGKMPGSMKVAIQKLANTKRKMMPLYIGMATEKFSESHGHLRHKKENKRDKEKFKISSETFMCHDMCRD